MATTLEGFVTALQGLEIAGVKRVLTAPPGSLTTSDFPALWVNSAGTRQTPIAKSSIVWPIHTAELYLVVSPVAQSTASKSFADAIAYADRLRAALHTATLAIGQATIAVRTEILMLNEKSYWGVVGTVEAPG